MALPVYTIEGRTGRNCCNAIYFTDIIHSEKQLYQSQGLLGKFFVREGRFFDRNDVRKFLIIKNIQIIFPDYSSISGDKG